MISELQNKDVVALEDGKKIGSIIDAAVDKDGNITSSKKTFFLKYICTVRRGRNKVE